MTGQLGRRADVIVVGAGSGGCVLARRLLDRGLRVLLLEAGERDRSPLIRAPAAFPRLYCSRYDWAFETVPQAHADGRPFFWPRGKVLGGSSAINATIWIRGSRRDFDAWGEGWRWADVLPAFRALERFSGTPGDTRGADGPLPVGLRRDSHAMSHAFVQSAVRALGVPAAASFNDGTLAGAALLESNHLRGERFSAFRAFLRPVLSHPNLTVLTGAHVLKVLFQGTRAVGVRLRWQGRTLDAPAGGVVLTAGAVQTPQLLLLSGVGPLGELARHGIEPVAAVPGVGVGLQDHPAIPVIYRSGTPSLEAMPELEALARYALTRRGPLSSNVAEACAFTHARADLNPAQDDPDIQFLFGPAYFRDHGFQKAHGHHFSVGPVLVDVHSRGRITLASRDPRAAPLIDPAYFSDERDVRSMVSGLRLAREIAGAPPLAGHARGEVVPGAAVQSDGALRAYLRAEAATLYHPTSTAVLGDGPEAVVDRQLAVRDTAGLWVADASVMPRVIHANTNATSMMIGERAAAFVAGGL
ncbi:GMC family oxidoreductase [Deinococcus ficus]|uniref:GMC family oxidoreductase n=1 Tax=Deinococcus ficus TaxID=317577 RepID=UPI0003B522A7|nr:GMC family oxidoreductase N-terminal domain-containing protein [Deinococcus ficus]